MSLVSDVIKILTNTYGWLIVVIVISYWVYWPIWETKVQSWIGGFNDQLSDIQDKQMALTQVVRALARSNSDPQLHMNPEHVDDQLVSDDGVEPNDFIIAQDDRMNDEDNKGYQ